MKILLFNPFKYVAGLKALLIGLLVMLITAVVAFFTKTHFDGIIDAHTGHILPFYWYLLEPLLAWIGAVIPFYLAARIFSKSSIRLIDMAGTLALARWPYLFVAALNFTLPSAPPTDIHQIGAALILALFAELLLGIWMVALMYNAFTVSSNLKGRRGTFIFITTLLVAEVLSKLTFYQLYGHLT
jgi:hypothetical protein